LRASSDFPLNGKLFFYGLLIVHSEMSLSICEFIIIDPTIFGIPLSWQKTGSY
jgi:hypothetical protein